MRKKFWIAGVLAFLLSFLLSFVAHGLLLHNDRAHLPGVFRTGEEVLNYFPHMLFSHLIKGFAFAWIYEKGYSADQPWLTQGIRFGIAMALVISVPYYLVYYAALPLTGTIVVKQIIFDSTINILMALAVAFVYKNFLQARPANTTD